MAQNETFILHAALDGRRSVYRDIEIDPAKSLYKLAEAIVQAFGFDFDHAFGFYTGLTLSKIKVVHPQYELFADMGQADPGVLGVEKTRIFHAFPQAGHTLLFLFDYGDDWLFRITLKATGIKQPKARYPRVVAAKGKAPEQYPQADEDEIDGPRIGINPRTGEVISFGKK
ncbi:IS1096 element passenger TnpR family protein [Bradyrhizobium sp. STM 3557]|uniref:IS1096 element passenger TnpR family protein n=1 Tax=Bradyrhizobium sp. STM 3557 TaxID=578920 RepID=UPI00388F4CF0